MNFVLKTRNCVSKTRICVLKMMNFADVGRSVAGRAERSGAGAFCAVARTEEREDSDAPGVGAAVCERAPRRQWLAERQPGGGVF